MLVTQGRLEPAETLLLQLIEHLRADSEDSEVQGMRGFVQLLFTYLAVLKGKAESIRLPERAVLEVIPERFLAMRNSADVIYAMLLSFQGEFEPAIEILIQTVQRDLSAGGTTATPISIALSARLLSLQGRLHQAADLCRKYMQVVMDRGAWRFYLAGDLNIILGEILREWNKLDEAEQEIQAGMRANEPWKITQGTAIGYIALARLQFARGHVSDALRTLTEAEQLISGKILTPDLASEMRNLKLTFELAHHELPHAEIWAEHLPVTATGDYRYELDFIFLARLRIHQKKHAEAVLLLQELSRQAEAGKRSLRLIKINLLWAQALRELNQTPEALQKLECCLSLARPEGILRTFLEEGEPVRELLSIYVHAASGIEKNFAQQLLNEFSSSLPDTSPRMKPTSGLVEPLTPREAEILGLLCKGLSNDEIASQLVITLNTVKRHNNSIFSKLGVANRSQAILRAHQLGLVQMQD